MELIDFPETNAIFSPPKDLSQCLPVRAFLGNAAGGSLDGMEIIVVAWKPTQLERQAIYDGAPVYLSVLGGLPAHFLTTNFEEATHPA